MKKNLILAAVLASVTMAAENEWALDLVSTLPSEPTTVNGLTYSAWTAVFKASPTAETTTTLDFKDTSASNWKEFSKGELLSNQILGDNNKTIIFTFSITNDSSELVTLNSFNVTAFAANDSGDKIGSNRGETLILTFGGNSAKEISTTLVAGQKVQVEFEFTQPVELAAGQQVDVNLQVRRNGNQFYPGFSSVSVKGTPEPATATLSLLALAGLASRRRRK